jgi:D-3-phosphoglycerate dehydrogenase / 2-oxoglutarate reductase
MDILITEAFDDPAVDRLDNNHNVVCAPGVFNEPDKLRELIGDARAIIVRNQTQLTAEVLAAATNLIGIGRMGVGLDNIDVKTASELGIVVVAPLDANATSVAEVSLGLMLGLARKIPMADRTTKAGGWDRKGCTGVELAEKTLAICGFGRVGRKVARYARAFGMSVVVSDPFVEADSPALAEVEGKLCATVEEALAAADYISAHSPLTPETKQMFNADRFAAMKPGAFFLNTSRGGIVDEAALVAALKSGHLGGAALDVREKEPPGEPSELEAMDNVILMPHVGGWTAEALSRTHSAVAGDIESLLAGGAAKNFVNFEKPNR